MKQLIAIALLALLAMPLASSCLAPEVRAASLFTPAETTWPSVGEDFFRGIEDATDAGELTLAAADSLRDQWGEMLDALRSQDPARLRAVPWPAMKVFAERGVGVALAEGSLGAFSAASAREQIQTFDQVVAQLRLLNQSR